MKFYILVCLIIFPSLIMPASAQVNITGVPFLLAQPSAQGMLTGGASSASPSLNPAAFFYNPAHLGYIGHNQGISASGFYKSMEWLPSFDRDLTYNHWSAAGGVNLSDQLPVPLSIGAGFLRSYFDLGKYSVHDEYGIHIGNFSSEEHYNMYGIGLHLDYPIKISLGYSRKYITSNLAPPNTPATAKAYDAGVTFSYSYSHEYFDAGITLSNAIRNVGNRIKYSSESPAAPLPRMSVIGYELSAGHTFSDHGLTLQLLRVDWTLEASDILVNFDSMERNYTRWPGNIQLVDHVLLGKDDDQVYVRRGARFHFLEAVTIGIGSFKGPDSPERIDTKGYIINSSGMLKLVNYFWDQPLLASINEHLSVTYANTRLTPQIPDHPISGTRYQEITVIWNLF